MCQVLCIIHIKVSFHGFSSIAPSWDAKNQHKYKTITFPLSTYVNMGENIPFAPIFNTVSNSKPRNENPEWPETKRRLKVTAITGRWSGTLTPPMSQEEREAVAAEGVESYEQNYVALSPASARSGNQTPCMKPGVPKPRFIASSKSGTTEPSISRWEEQGSESFPWAVMVTWINQSVKSNQIHKCQRPEFLLLVCCRNPKLGNYPEILSAIGKCKILPQECSGRFLWTPLSLSSP